ncbi:hypothetical protein GIB67_032903, partial [Kingdonia uniflora]
MSSQIPSCDICQERAGYFFCLEDRALLCTQCDVSIHSYMSPHQQFLLTGAKAGLHQPSNINNGHILNSLGSYSTSIDPVADIKFLETQTSSASLLGEIFSNTDFSHIQEF